MSKSKTTVMTLAREIKSEADASDVTQQVFVRAFRGLASFRGAASVRSWLYRIAINCSLSWIRDHKREQPAEIEDHQLVAAATAPGRISDTEDGIPLQRDVAHLTRSPVGVPPPSVTWASLVISSTAS